MPGPLIRKHPLLKDLVSPLVSSDILTRQLVDLLKTWNPDRVLEMLAPWAYRVFVWEESWEPDTLLDTAPGIEVLNATERQRLLRGNFDAFVTGRQIAYLAKAICLLSCGLLTPTHRQIVCACLAITQVSEPDYGKIRGCKPEILALIQYLEKNTNESLGLSWYRYNHLLFGNIAQKHKVSELLKHIKRKMGMTIERVLALLYAVDVMVMDQYNRDQFVGKINVASLVSEVISEGELRTFVDAVSILPADLRLAGNCAANFEVQWLKDLTCFRDHPLIRIDKDEVICPWYYSVRHSTENAFWMCLNWLVHDKNTFRTRLGKAFEDYLAELWKQRNDVTVAKETTYDGKVSTDLFLLDPAVGTMIAIEGKTARYRIDQYVPGDGFDILNKTTNDIMGAFAQLSSGLEDFEKGKYKVNGLSATGFHSIVPVVCTLTPMHLGPLYWVEIIKRIKDKGLFTGSKYKSPRLMSAREMEDLFIYTAVPHNLLADWAASDMEAYTFHDYAYDNLRSVSKNDAWVEGTWKEMTEVIAGRIGLGPRAPQ